MAEATFKVLILILGWPVLMVGSVFILSRGLAFYRELRDQTIGKMIIPSMIGWIFGLYALAIVATSYMLDFPWYYSILPSFLGFAIVMVMLITTIDRIKKEGKQLRKYYTNLEVLVKERTEELESLNTNLENIVKRRTAQLEKAHKKELESEQKLQELKDQFVNIAAHELRTPITSMSWGLEAFIDTEAKQLNTASKELLQNVYEANQKLIKLVDDLLNIARIEAGKMKFSPEMFDLSKLIKKTAENLKPMFKEHNVKINLKGVKSGTIYADESKVQQVLNNLLSNACKYNKPKGKVTIETKVRKNDIAVSIEDTGIGIAKKDIKTIFKRFGRIQTKETADIPGTGLGLFYVKEIVKQSGGDIKVKSILGKGTTMTFTLPLNKPKTKK